MGSIAVAVGSSPHLESRWIALSASTLALWVVGANPREQTSLLTRLRSMFGFILIVIGMAQHGFLRKCWAG